jgi:hypothetical protein
MTVQKSELWIVSKLVQIFATSINFETYMVGITHPTRHRFQLLLRNASANNFQLSTKFRLILSVPSDWLMMRLCERVSKQQNQCNN